MKTTLSLLTILLSLHTATAQIVNIPDPIFKQRIIDNGVDTNFDGEIQYSEAEAVTILDVNGQFDDIFDLTGIEAFVNITELYCQLNALTTLDLSQNTSLVKLFCMDNPLTNINVTQCIALELLEAEHTQLTDIDLSNNANLALITISDAQLTDLDITNNSNLESISLYNINPLIFLDIRNGNNTNITGFGSHENPNLTCIFVDDATYWETNFGSNIDPNSHFVETQAECDALGVNENDLEELQVYPNPVMDILYLSNYYNKLSQYTKLIITDILGKVVLDSDLESLNMEINVSQLEKGIYFLLVKTNTTQQTIKFLKI